MGEVIPLFGPTPVFTKVCITCVRSPAPAFLVSMVEQGGREFIMTDALSLEAAREMAADLAADYQPALAVVEEGFT